MTVAIILNSPDPIANVAENDVIYADAGYKNKPLLTDKNTLAVVGDFDTLGVVPEKENVVHLDVEKDFTDGEIAVRCAKEHGATELTVYGAFGGKPEHILGNITLLAIAGEIGLEAKIKGDNYSVYLVSGAREFKTQKGVSVSLIPYTDECVVTDSRGLYYPLKNLPLTKYETLGISNKTTENGFYINVIKGKVLAIVYDRP